MRRIGWFIHDTARTCHTWGARNLVIFRRSLGGAQWSEKEKLHDTEASTNNIWEILTNDPNDPRWWMHVEGKQSNKRLKQSKCNILRLMIFCLMIMSSSFTGWAWSAKKRGFLHKRRVSVKVLSHPGRGVESGRANMPTGLVHVILKTFILSSKRLLQIYVPVLVPGTWEIGIWIRAEFFFFFPNIAIAVSFVIIFFLCIINTDKHKKYYIK